MSRSVNPQASVITVVRRSVLERKAAARRRITGGRRTMRTSATDHDAAIRRVRDGHVTAQHLGAIAHEFHSHAVAARVSFIETPTVVLNTEGQCSFCRGELDGD